MPIKLIADTEAPVRRVVEGKTATIKEFGEALEAIKNLPAGKAISLELSNETYAAIKRDKKDNPAEWLAAVLRRKFNAIAVPFTAYSSKTDKSMKVVTIIRVAKK